MTTSTHIIFDLLTNYFEDPEWSHIDIVSLASSCKSAQIACSKTLQWSKEHRWNHYRITCDGWKPYLHSILFFSALPMLSHSQLRSKSCL